MQEWDALSIFNNIQLLFLYGALSYHFVIVQNQLHLDPPNTNVNSNSNWNGGGGDRPSRLARLFRRDYPLRAVLNLTCLLGGGLVFGSMSSVPALQSSLSTDPDSKLSSTQIVVYLGLGGVVVAVVAWHLGYAYTHFSRGPHLRVYLLSRGAVFSFFAIQVRTYPRRRSTKPPAVGYEPESRGFSAAGTLITN